MDRPNNTLCTKCNRSFLRFSNLRKHVKKFHPLELEVLAPLKVKTYQFQCPPCNKNFSYKHHYTMHMKMYHMNPEDAANTITKPIKCGMKCPLCDFVAKFKSNFYSHVKSEHSINVEIKKRIFHSERKFSSWLAYTEKETRSKFVIKRRGVSTKATFTGYMCHRSGFFQSRGTGKRRLKTQGSRKINGFCPAGLEVSIEKENGKHKVTYVKTHIGHDNDLCHLLLSHEEKEMLAAQIATKIPFDAILDGIRDNVSETSLGRLHLLTRRDLINIKAGFNLQSTSQEHSNGVDTWVDEMKDTCILFYKPQDTLSEDYPQLKREDFLLIIMTDGQKIILEKYSKNCICIDRTHQVNTYNFELHTLLVLDELQQGFPCAFCISSRSDQEAIAIFLSCIKSEVGPISTKVFMSDKADMYYSAWMQVMQAAENRFFCSWHLDEAWRNDILCIRLKEKQVAVYKMLRTFLQETDKGNFEELVEEFKDALLNDAETVTFGRYFVTNYFENRKSWAYCYQTHSGSNTNVHIERLHRSIKYFYLQGQNVEKLDKATGALMKLTRDHLFDRLYTLNGEKICSKLKRLEKKHNNSKTLDIGSIVDNGNGFWQIPYPSGNKNMYTIFENTNNHCECKLNCSECQACIHKYSCDCLDSAIRWNMCKHIHLVCRYIKEKVKEEPGLI